MSQTPIENTINRLLELQNETRELLREAHETIRDLRQTKREIDKLLGPVAKAKVEHEVGELVKKELEELGPQMRQFSSRIYDRVGNQINKLIDLCMGQEFSAKNGREDIRPLLALKLREWLGEIVLEEMEAQP